MITYILRRKYRFVFVIAAVAVIIASFAFSRSNLDPVEVSSRRVFIETPAISEQTAVLEGYFAHQFSRLVVADTLLDEALSKAAVFCETALRPRVELVPVGRGTQSFDLTLVAFEPDYADDVLEELLQLLESRLAEIARLVIVETIAHLEGELNGLTSRRGYAEASNPTGPSTVDRERTLLVNIERLRYILGHPPKLIRVAPLTSSVAARAFDGPQSLLFILGLVIVLLFLLEYALAIGARHRCRLALETRAGIPVLGFIPQLDSSLTLRTNPMGAAAEALRAIRTEVTRTAATRVAFVSWGHGEGTSTICANLALALAELGRSVVIVDGNMRRPGLHELFEVSNDIGLSDVLIDTEPSDAVWDAAEDSLKLLAAGPPPPDAAALLQGRRAAVLSTIGQRLSAEYTLFDLAPMAASADVSALSAHVDAIIFIARPGFEKADTVIGAIKRLKASGLPLLGLVLNDVSAAPTTEKIYTKEMR